LVAAVITITALASAEGAAELAESIRATPEALEGELDIETLVSIAQATAIGVQVLMAVLTLAVIVWIILALRAGRGYIRIVLSVLAVLQAFATLSAPSALTVANLVLVATAVVLSWLPPSSHYIAATSRRRRDERQPHLSPTP